MDDVSRRSVLKMSGAAAAAGAFASSGRTATEDRTVLRPASYGEVALLGGPMLAQFRAQHATLLAMDDDALLRPFRESAGLPAPGPDLGGWYNASPHFHPPTDMHGYIPGHCFGQYVSSLARAYAITGDPGTKAKVQRLLEGFATTISPKFYDGYPLPAYTFDKTNIGLIDAHAFCGDPNALAMLNRATDAVLPYLPEKALTRPEMKARPHPNMAFEWDESYTLPENLYLAWRRGAGERFHALALRYLQDREYFDPLARGENVLPGQHAYSHMNALNSAMQAYLCDGSSKHLAAAKNGLSFVLAQSYATGGWGPDERFIAPGSGDLGNSLDTTHASFETPCGAYGHFKAARYLMSATGDSTYGDSMERVLYNTVLGALPMKPDGTAFYYSDYNSTGAKAYNDYTCTCCSGTLGQVVADYGISSYFANAGGVFVNLYAPSRFTWHDGGRDVAIVQATDYPLGSVVEMTIKAARPETFSLALRIPAWAEKGTAVEINGNRAAEPPMPGTFYRIAREWHDGDRVTLALDMPLRLEAVDAQHPDLVAALWGPLALFAVGDRFLPFRRSELFDLRQTAPRSAEWRLATQDGVQRFMPFFAIGTEQTRLYQPLVT